MKIKGMPCDQYKMSIEARPLQVLYTKYNHAEDIAPYQSVRPLGRVRQDRRPSSEHSRRCFPDTGVREKTTLNGAKDMKLNRRGDSDKITNRFRSEQSVSALDIRDNNPGINRENTAFPAVHLSKSQAFENKFKIAAARGNGNDSPLLRPTRSFDKKVVHLPLFRINLKTYAGESEVSRTVAKTRESLRKLMELHKSKMKHNSVMTANIRNYEFSAPISSANTTSRTSDVLLSKPFHAKPALRSSRGNRDIKSKYPILSRQVSRASLHDTSEEKHDVYTNDDISCCHIRSLPYKHYHGVIDTDDEPDDSMLSIAIRPDTSLTLGSTMHHLDRVIKSPGSDELRELSEAFKNSDTQPSWPNVDEIHRLTAVSRNHSRNRRSRTSFSRPGTVLNDLLETPDEECERYHQCPEHYHSYDPGPKPILRYTSKPSTYKLDPIVVPSHTCMECPVCNIYQREVETPCPPNTPNTGQFNLDPSTDPHIYRPPFIRGTKLTSRPEVMRISRIYLDGTEDAPPRDGNIMGFMKAS